MIRQLVSEQLVVARSARSGTEVVREGRGRVGGWMLDNGYWKKDYLGESSN